MNTEEIIRENTALREAIISNYSLLNHIKNTMLFYQIKLDDLVKILDSEELNQDEIKKTAQKLKEIINKICG
jgi:hypothetical protein